MRGQNEHQRIEKWGLQLKQKQSKSSNKKNTWNIMIWAGHVQRVDDDTRPKERGKGRRMLRVKFKTRDGEG